jgi:hypothetical protein
MANNNDKKDNGFKRFVNRCTAVWKIILGVAVVVGLIGAFYGLDSVIATEKDLDIYKKDTNAEFEKLRGEVLATFQEIQKNQQQMLKNQQIQFWSQKYQEYLDKEMEFKYKWRANPNNQDLKKQYEMWKSKREGAQKKLQELTGGTG